MSGAGPPELPPGFASAVTRVGAATLATLQALEIVARRLHPPALPSLRESLAPVAGRLAAALDETREVTAPAPLLSFHEALRNAAGHADAAARGLLAPAPPLEAAPRILQALSQACRAQEALYPLRVALDPVARFFTEPSLHGQLEALEPEPPPGVRVGLMAAQGGADGRGGFHLYVPERYRPERAWPLVVALHGAYGSGADFVWSWLREARSRGFLVLAPTSRGATWPLAGGDVEGPALRRRVEQVQARWRVDPDRILLAGLSDGGSYALRCGMAEDSPAGHVACVAGVLPPGWAAGEPAARSPRRRVLLVHGALDWVFPVALARAARDSLSAAGADVTYREIPDLSHTWPREENDRILRWLDPGLVPRA